MDPTREPLHELLTREAPTTWLFYGDSIAQGSRHTFGHRDYSELFAERVRYELDRTGDVVINTAVSGDTTRELLEEYDTRVAQFEPDAMFLMVGMNDCSSDRPVTEAEFTANLHALVDRNEQRDVVTVMQTTCPVVSGSAPNREAEFEAYMEAIRTVAGDRDAPLLDHAAYWNEHSGSQFHWMSNAFHPNHYGHRVFATLVFRTLGIWDTSSHTCGLFVPGLQTE